MNTEHFKTTSEENIANKNNSIQMMNSHVTNLDTYKARLENIMKVTKDKNELDDYLDVYIALDKTMKKVATIYAVYAVMFDVKEKEPNKLSDSLIKTTVSYEINKADYIPNELKQFVKDNNLIEIIFSEDFNKDDFLYKLFVELQNIIMNKLKI